MIQLRIHVQNGGSLGILVLWVCYHGAAGRLQGGA